MGRLALVLLLITLGLASTACGDKGGAASSSSSAAAPTTAPTARTPAPTTAGTATSPAPAKPAASSVRTIATGLHVPWGIVFLPNGDALVSERTTGLILRIPKGGGRPRVAMRVRGVDTAAGEGGLLGLALSPSYARDGLVYAYFTSASDNRIVRFHLGGPLHPILTGLRRGVIHDAGRIAFGPDGKLYAGVGETGVGPLAQNVHSDNGKILRMNPDGSVPRDNPFRGSLVWSYGNRDPQGLAWDSAGRLWSSEFGQDKADEVNLIRKGGDYGWPIVEGKGPTHGGRYINPLVTWPVAEASPSGDAVLGATLYVAALRGERLWRIPLRGSRLGTPVALFTGRFGRLRTVVVAPDRSLWISTSNRDGRGSPRAGDDRIIRYVP